jgi:hypothetical protein
MTCQDNTQPEPLEATDRLDRLEDLFLARERGRRGEKAVLAGLVIACLALASATTYLFLTRPTATAAHAPTPEEPLVQAQAEGGGPACIGRIDAFTIESTEYINHLSEGMSDRERKWRITQIGNRAEALLADCEAWMTPRDKALAGVAVVNRDREGP